jgi:hypothetical protein
MYAFESDWNFCFKTIQLFKALMHLPRKKDFLKYQQEVYCFLFLINDNSSFLAIISAKSARIKQIFLSYFHILTGSHCSIFRAFFAVLHIATSA